MGMFILCYTQMQLAELLIWRGIDTKNPTLNKVGTAIGKWSLPLHNVAIGLGILLSTALIAKRPLRLPDYLPLVIGLLFFGIIVLFWFPKEPDSASETFPSQPLCADRKCQNSKNRLQWPFPHHYYWVSFLVSMAIMLIWLRPLSLEIWYVFLFAITAYLATQNQTRETQGSTWCYTTALIAPLVAIGGHFIIRKLPNSAIRA
jgi:hypothetical protein